jgi:hypothetical protein
VIDHPFREVDNARRQYNKHEYHETRHKGWPDLMENVPVDCKFHEAGELRRAGFKKNSSIVNAMRRTPRLLFAAVA